jgi:metal-sulfur cluster biosynthetic enzyme
MDQAATLDARLAELRGIIAEVRDPEIDETVADLDLIVDLNIEGGKVTATLRMPTFWCPANFVWLMAEDIRERILALSWVSDFELRLVDHFAAAEISQGVSLRHGFDAAFPRLAEGGLRPLRRDFAAKGMLMRQAKLIQALRGHGLSDAEICAANVAEMDSMASSDPLKQLWQAVQERRQSAELDDTPDAPAICDAAGTRISDLSQHLREVRRVVTNAAANGEMCRMLVAARRERGSTCRAFPPHGPYGSASVPAVAGQYPDSRQEGFRDEHPKISDDAHHASGEGSR